MHIVNSKRSKSQVTISWSFLKILYLVFCVVNVKKDRGGGHLLVQCIGREFCWFKSRGILRVNNRCS